MREVHVAFSDPRERADPILGIFDEEYMAYAKVGEYIMNHNTKEDLNNRWLKTPLEEMSYEDIGRSQCLFNQFSCILGYVQKFPVQ